MHVPSSTIADIQRGHESAAAVWSRRAFLGVLAVFVLAGVAGLLGVRTTTQTDRADGWSLSLRHASVARAGLDVPWEVTVTHEGGLGKEVELAVTGAYFDIFETQGFHPEPTEETRDGDTLYLTFTAPPGDTLVVAYDAYIQPASQVGHSGTVSVVEDGSPVTSLDFDTTLLP